jgi:hypothetical protein
MALRDLAGVYVLVVVVEKPLDPIRLCGIVRRHTQMDT